MNIQKRLQGRYWKDLIKKGGDLYKIDPVERKLTDRPVGADLEEILEIRVPYMMRTKNASKDPAKPSEESAVQEKGTLKDKTIKISDLTYELSGITLTEIGVYINPHEDVLISHYAFIRGLDSITKNS